VASLREGTRIGPYVVETLLPEGRGGFAQVVLARRVSEQGLYEKVALKLAKTRAPAGDPRRAAELVQAFERTLIEEAETLCQLRHPGIVSIYPIRMEGRRICYRARALELDGQPWYFVMEHLTGGTLETLAAERRILDLPLAVEIAQQVCVVLDYVHTKGFAHLDIKASNVLFRQPFDGNASPQAVLVDFGTAQKFALSPVDEGLTLSYSPPERVRVRKGEAPPESVVDKAAVDVYSLGVLLYRMLTGRLPFTGSRSHIETAILTQTPTRPEVYNPALKRLPELDGLIMAMLEKQPAARPRARDVVARLEEIVPSPRVGTDVGVNPGPRKRANAWKRAAVIFLSLAALEAAGLSYLWSNNPIIPWIPTPVPTTAVPTPIASPAPIPTLTPTPTRVTISPTPTKTATATTQEPTVTPSKVPPTGKPVKTFTPTPPPSPTPKPTVTPGTSQARATTGTPRILAATNMQSPLPTNTPTAVPWPTTRAPRPTTPVPRPTDTPRPPTDTPEPLTDTPVPPTSTPRRPTDTPRPPTDTPRPPTDTPRPPTNTPRPPTDTPRPPTNTPRPPTDTPRPPTNTPRPPTDTPRPPTNTPRPPTDTPRPPTNTPRPPTNTPRPPTDTPEPEPPTDTPVSRKTPTPFLTANPY
jgi:serine/threonine protein kinase